MGSKGCGDKKGGKTGKKKEATPAILHNARWKIIGSSCTVGPRGTVIGGKNNSQMGNLGRKGGQKRRSPSFGKK